MPLASCLVEIRFAAQVLQYGSVKVDSAHGGPRQVTGHSPPSSGRSSEQPAPPACPPGNVSWRAQLAGRVRRTSTPTLTAVSAAAPARTPPQTASPRRLNAEHKTVTALPSPPVRSALKNGHRSVSCSAVATANSGWNLTADTVLCYSTSGGWRLQSTTAS